MRVMAFIDGFNLYLSMREVIGYDLCWSDYGVLCRGLLGKGQRLERIHYFSAWSPRSKSLERHRAFVNVQCLKESPGFFNAVWGEHKPRWQVCAKCGHERPGHEEKKTDVNLALTMYELAVRDMYDLALLITRDTDQQPTIDFVHRLGNPTNKMIWLVLPPGEAGERTDWGGRPDKVIRLTVEDFERARLPGRVIGRNGVGINIDRYRREGAGRRSGQQNTGQRDVTR